MCRMFYGLCLMTAGGLEDGAPSCRLVAHGYTCVCMKHCRKYSHRTCGGGMAQAVRTSCHGMRGWGIRPQGEQGRDGGGYSSKSNMSSSSSYSPSKPKTGMALKSSRARRSFFVGRPVPRCLSMNPDIRDISSSSYCFFSVTFS